jgi:uroporphyrinogen-III synthase
MRPLVVIRPEPGLAATVANARAAGFDVHGFALFAIAPVGWEPPNPARIDALLLGSANAARHAGSALEKFAHLPAHVVGKATAEAALAAGLQVASVGAGGLQAVLDGLAGSPLHLLRLAGRERVALVPPEGITLTERVVYASEPVPMPAALARLLSGDTVVLLHSGEAAGHFAAECERLRLDRARITLAAIGPRVADAAGSGWARVATAARPDDAALLALAGELCQIRGKSLDERDWKSGSKP